MKSTIIVLLIFISLAIAVIAVPYGPGSVTVEKSERRTEFNESVATVQAQAGNVTQLIISTTILTKRWQGYYGNLSGTVTLDDGSGYTMYDWNGFDGYSPVGEVYAANFTVSDWTNVLCINLTGNGLPGDRGPNTTILEDWIGANPNDVDGIDETFTSTDDIAIGSTMLLDCPATHIYNGTGNQTTHWNETLLWENHSSGLTTVIFAADVNQNTNGFNNETLDFQMIVAENGDISATTTYYFYVELV
jgi:hypothetical protein